MADFRWDPISGQWVIIAAHRAHRPNEFQTTVDCPPATECPFCHGNESSTPPEIAIYRSDEPDSRWSTRVFANKYPAVETNNGMGLELSLIHI